jgi:hypothetical protein
MVTLLQVIKWESAVFLSQLFREWEFLKIFPVQDLGFLKGQNGTAENIPAVRKTKNPGENITGIREESF